MHEARIKKRRLVPRESAVVAVAPKPPAAPRRKDILRFDIRDIVDAVSAVLNIRAKHIEDRDFTISHVERARSIAIQVAHEKGHSFASIAAYFGDPSSETMRLRSRVDVQLFMEHPRGRAQIKQIRDALSSVNHFNALVMNDERGRRFKRAIAAVPVKTEDKATAELKAKILRLKDMRHSAKSVVKITGASPEYVAEVMGVHVSFARMR